MSASDMWMPVHQGLAARPARHRRHRRIDPAQLAVDPGLAALPSLRPAQVCSRRARIDGVEHAVGQRLPGAHLGAFAATLGHQLAHRRQRIEVLDDDARIEQRLAAFHHQTRHLAERIGFEDVRRCPRRLRASSWKSSFFSAITMRTLRT